MNIIIHCGGIPFNGNTINERSLGGSESAAYYLAKGLAALNHDVTIFTNSQEEGSWDGVKYVFSGNQTEQTPLGNRFDFYASNTPHDVLVIQRSPFSFRKRYASKINILWLHDLALYRSQAAMVEQMWNVDAVFCVSNYHKTQVCEVYGLDPDFVYAIENGVDVSLFEGVGDEFEQKHLVGIKELLKDKALLTYSSRPERGLEHLVCEGGIMERLLAEDPNLHLAVCGYDNTTPEMAGFYNYLWERCETLPNVTNLGALSKSDLASLLSSAFLHVYPTEFEEVSCITAMEVANAGIPFISSDCAALPETCGDSGSILIPMYGGIADEDEFVRVVSELAIKNSVNWGNLDYTYDELVELQKLKAPEYSWDCAVQRIDNILTSLKSADGFSEASVQKGLLRNSDIVPLTLMSGGAGTSLVDSIDKELGECYPFFFDDEFEDHYKAYYQYEADRGVNYGPEAMEGNLRFESVSTLIASLPDGSTVLDYGCAHGHFTNNLAKRFPKLKFVGADLDVSNAEKATDWAETECIENTVFWHGDKTFVSDTGIKFDCVIAAEVLEHVADVTEYIAALQTVLRPGGLFVATTPYGPWEALGYRAQWPWRAHLYHLDRADIQHLVGHLDNFNITGVPHQVLPSGEPIGSYMWSFTYNPDDGPKDYIKEGLLIPHKQTLSVLILAKDAEDSIVRCIKSVADVADEIVIGVDSTTEDATALVASEYKRKHLPDVGLTVLNAPPALSAGFSYARNRILEHVSGDWVLWLDTDEELVNPQNLVKYLRRNQFSGYALKQNHFSQEPAGVIKVDLPVKVFRTNKGIEFTGYIHEHPEEALNEGIKMVGGIADVNVAHYGYDDETIRRERFSRNLSLLVKDREEFPQRTLGKFLWLRDLAQMIQYEHEQTGQPSVGMAEKAKEGISLWRELLDDNLRMAIDGLPFYSVCVRTLNEGYELSFALDTNLIPGKANCSEVTPTDARFASEEDALNLLTVILKERSKNYGSKYF